jgi:hypothetical protein
MNTLFPLMALSALLIGGCSHATGREPPPPPPAQGNATIPPPEAFEACEGKAPGSRSGFTDARGESLKGVCLDDGHGSMVLRPDRPPKDRRNPPPEAYAACEGKAEGAPAQLVGPQGETVTGTCGFEGNRLVLRPDRPPR